MDLEDKRGQLRRTPGFGFVAVNWERGERRRNRRENMPEETECLWGENKIKLVI